MSKLELQALQREVDQAVVQELGYLQPAWACAYEQSKPKTRSARIRTDAGQRLSR